MWNFIWDNKFTIILHIVEIILFSILLINIYKQDVYVGMLVSILPILYFTSKEEQKGNLP